MSETICLAKKIREAAIKEDEEAKKRGNNLKYIIEYLKEDGEIKDVKCFYSIQYISNSEAIKQINTKKENINLRGPFPLFKNAISDSKIARWELEKERNKKDKEKIEKIIEKAKKNKDKYIHFIFSTVFKIDRLIAYKNSQDCFSEELLSKVLKSLEKNKDEYEKKIVTLNVETREEVERKL